MIPIISRAPRRIPGEVFRVLEARECFRDSCTISIKGSLAKVAQLWSVHGTGKGFLPIDARFPLHSLFAGRCTLGIILFYWKVLYLPSPTQTLGEVPGVGFTNSLGVPRAPISHVHLEPGLDLGSHRQSPLPFNIVSLSSSHCRSMNIQRASPKKDILQTCRPANKIDGMNELIQ